MSLLGWKDDEPVAAAPPPPPPPPSDTPPLRTLMGMGRCVLFCLTLGGASPVVWS